MKLTFEVKAGNTVQIPVAPGATVKDVKVSCTEDVQFQNLNDFMTSHLESLLAQQKT